MRASECAEKNDHQIGMFAAQPSCGLDAVPVGHVHVHQDESRVQHIDQVERLTSRRRGADDLEAGRCRYDGAEDVLKDLAIVDDEYAHRQLILGGHSVKTLPTRPARRKTRMGQGAARPDRTQEQREARSIDPGVRCSRGGDRTALLATPFVVSRPLGGRRDRRAFSRR